MAKTEYRGLRGELRIIGGNWRGRKLRFTPAQGLRPTADRTRETLFNWLAPEINGARCLDLFAGSGALGLEALSRGASHCDFVDQARACTEQIAEHINTLDALNSARVHATSADQFLEAAKNAYDIVFLDPPFDKHLLQPACDKLAAGSLLSTAALIYLEMGAHEQPPQVPEDWTLHRDKRSAGVSYQLYRRKP